MMAQKASRSWDTVLTVRLENPSRPPAISARVIGRASSTVRATFFVAKRQARVIHAPADEIGQQGPSCPRHMHRND
jgi:hypothetical protein